MKELERENRELRRSNEILKAAAAFFGGELDRHRLDDPVHRPAQAFVRGRADLPSCRSPRRPTTPPGAACPRPARCPTPPSADVIGRVHRANYGVYGIRKVWKALRRQTSTPAATSRPPAR